MNVRSVTTELPLKDHADGFRYLTMQECREFPFVLSFVERFYECFECDFDRFIFIFHPHGDAPADRRPIKNTWLHVAATSDRAVRRDPGVARGEGAPFGAIE